MHRKECRVVALAGPSLVSSLLARDGPAPPPGQQPWGRALLRVLRRASREGKGQVKGRV